MAVWGSPVRVGILYAAVTDSDTGLETADTERGGCFQRLSEGAAEKRGGAGLARID